MFNDTKLEEMGWLASVCEPVIDPLNDMLAVLPDHIPILDPSMILDRDDRIPTYITTANVLSKALGAYLNDEQMQYLHTLRRYNFHHDPELARLEQCFMFQSHGEPTINFTDNTITGGEIFLKKTKDHFEEKESLAVLGQQGIRLINYWHTIRIDFLNEILDLLGLQSMMRSKNAAKKTLTLNVELERVMSKNEWRIRDVQLANKATVWIYAYITEGNLAALSNFCKLKAMTHNRESTSIYSIPEEQPL